MWDECNCAVVWAFFGDAFLWDWNKIKVKKENSFHKSIKKTLRNEYDKRSLKLILQKLQILLKEIKDLNHSKNIQDYGSEKIKLVKWQCSSNWSINKMQFPSEYQLEFFIEIYDSKFT